MDAKKMTVEEREEAIEKVEPNAEDLEMWEVIASNPMRFSIELTMPQWAAVLAAVDGAVLTAPNPGIAKLCHIAIEEQVYARLDEMAATQ